jgi:hypothetical protein
MQDRLEQNHRLRSGLITQAAGGGNCCQTARVHRDDSQRLFFLTGEILKSEIKHKEVVLEVFILAKSDKLKKLKIARFIYLVFIFQPEG